MITASISPSQAAEAREYFEAKMAFTTGPVELAHALREGNVTVVDVRAKEDYDKGHIPGAVSLPKDKWDRPVGPSREQMNVLYCYSQVCHLAATAAVELTTQGFPVKELEGGIEGWKAAGFQLEK